MLCVSNPSSPPAHTTARDMRMLRQYNSRSDLENALESTKDVPDLLSVNHVIKHALSATSCQGQLLLFSYPFECPVYWFCYVQAKLESAEVMLLRNPSTPYDVATYNGALTQFLEILAKTLHDDQVFITMAESCLHYELTRLLPSFLPAHCAIYKKPYHLFHMNECQMAKLGKLELTLPYGYSFDKANTEEDATLIAETSEGTLTSDAVCDRLRDFPYIAVRGPQGSLVSHELSSPSAGLSHLFTHPDHRRRGLASTVELALAQKSARLGSVPFKGVCVYNTSQHRSSEESPFWTMLNRNGTPVEIMQQEYSINPPPSPQIRD